MGPARECGAGCVARGERGAVPAAVQAVPEAVTIASLYTHIIAKPL